MLGIIIDSISTFMYSKLLVILLIGAGIYFTIRTKLPQMRLFKDACKAVVEKPEDVENSKLQICLDDARKINKKLEVGDKAEIEQVPKNFGRIAAQKAKQVVVQKIREEERKVLYVQYLEKEREVITGIVQRYSGKNI